MLSATIVPYPLAPGLQLCKHFQVSVNGLTVPVEELSPPCPADAPDWFRSGPNTSVMKVFIAAFSCSGPATVTITSIAPVSSVVVRPKSKSLIPDLSGHKITFDIPGPCKLVVDMDDQPPLLIFADPIPDSAPDPATPNLKYFAPGVHEVGIMTLKDNESLYIAPGAIVYGGLCGNPCNARIFGRGTLDGSRHRGALVALNGAKNVSFDGITLRRGNGWQNTLTNCDSVIYHNVKVLSFVPCGDGIDPVCSRDITIDDCILRCSDDCISVKAIKAGPALEHIRVTNCVLAGYGFSDGFTIGFETDTISISKVLVKNCDVLCATGPSKIDGHSAFSIICDGPADIHDIVYEDIRVEESVPKLFELNVSDGMIYTKTSPGRIRNVLLKNISWESSKPIVLYGHDKNHQVEDVIFENCSIGGKQLTGPDFSALKTNQYTKNIAFI